MICAQHGMQHGLTLAPPSCLRWHATNEELYKDMESVLEKLCELTTWLQQHHAVQPADLGSRQLHIPVLGSSQSAEAIIGSPLAGAMQSPLGIAPEGSAAAEARNGSMQSQPGLSPVTLLALRVLLEFFDGCCCYLRGRARPSAWVSHVLKALKGFDAPTRERVAATTQVGSFSSSEKTALRTPLLLVVCTDQEAALALQVHSEIMQQAKEYWGPLKAPGLRSLFETPELQDSNESRPLKRLRR